MTPEEQVYWFWRWLEWRDRQLIRWFGWYWRLREWLMQFDKPCGYGCGWEAPYGFVPEAGCPRHDR